MNHSNVQKLIRLTQFVQQNPYCSCRSLSKFLEVSGRTIKRYVDTLKTDYDAPIRFDYGKKGYIFSAEWSFRIPDLTEGEVLALLLATSQIKQYNSLPGTVPLTSLENKVQVLFSDKISLSSDELTLILSSQINPVQVRKDTQEVFNCLFRATCDHIGVKIVYKTMSTQRTSIRKVDPYHIFQNQGVWYFCGYCHTREEIRDFALDRIKDCQSTGVKFVLPSDFDPQQYLSTAFRIMKGEAAQVSIWFDAHKAPLIRERIWHSSQIIHELPEGELLLQLQANPREIKRWVLGFGLHAVLREPDHLRQEILEEINEMKKKYKKKEKIVGKGTLNGTLKEYNGGK
jgi:predicted DNA-binding transcriptional regulator YafY